MPIAGHATRMAICAVCALALLAGCGPRKHRTSLAQAGVPAPGTMKVVSVEPLGPPPQPVDDANLIPGGDMKTWWRGASGPKGFLLPDGKISTVLKVVKDKDKDDGKGAFAVQQKWDSPDNPDKLESLFRAEAPNIEANAEYMLEITATGLIDIDVWEAAESGTPQHLLTSLISTQPGDGIAKRYVKKFKALSGGKLVIAAHSFAQPPESSLVQWHSWRLTRSAAQ